MKRRKGEVYYKNQYAGVLEETPNGGTRFSYDSNFQLSISCSLPRHLNIFECSNGLHPFFENLAPEGWLRAKQAYKANIQNKDSFGLLLEYGEDCIGAVGIRNYIENALPVQKKDNDIVESSIAVHRTISGVQRKLLCYKNSDKYLITTKPENSATHIAKLNSEENNSLVRNEFLSLSLAVEIFGHDQVTNFDLTYLDELKEISLIVERFDRTIDGKKLHMEEFAQILNKKTNNDFTGKYEGSYEEIAEAIKSYSSYVNSDLELFLKQLIFSMLVGNCDAHFKNFALLESYNGLRLAPCYDILNTLIYTEKNYDSRFALEFCGKKHQWSDIDRDLVFEFGKNIGLNLSTIENALQQIADGLNKSLNSGKYLQVHPSAGLDDFNIRYKNILDSACLRIL